jgi:UDP-glucose 4-epimerase
MKILITGKTGFIGSHLFEFLSVYHDVVSLSKNKLDLTNRNEVHKYLQNNIFDIIIHTATIGGKTGNNDGPEVLYNNIAMIFNLLHSKHPSTKLITFTSGYELDKNIHLSCDKNFAYHYPLDYYGMSKNIISRICKEYPDVYVFRLFGVYGEYETNNRFIKKNILNYINNQPIHIIQDRYLDFIYIDNILKIVNYYVNNIDNNLNHFTDITLPKKYKLTEIIKVINNLDKHKVEVITQKEGYDLEYVGDSNYFTQLIPNYVTLEEGIKNVYNYIKNINK